MEQQVSPDCIIFDVSCSIILVQLVNDFQKLYKDLKLFILRHSVLYFMKLEINSHQIPREESE